VSAVYYDPFDPGIDADPFDVYHRLRDEAPLYFNEKFGFYAISRYDDIKAALADWEHFSNIDALALEQPPLPPSIITMDPPDHDRQRKLVSRTFTPRRVAGLESFIRQLVRQYLAELPLDGTGDFVEDFSSKLPVAVICELLGVPSEDREQWRLWTKGMADMFVLGDDGVPEIKPNVIESAMAVAMYIDEMVEDREKNPSDDLVSALTAARLEGGDEFIKHEELVGLIAILLLAGNDTTNILLGNLMHALARFPDQRRRLFDAPGLIPAAVEETMRYDNSIHALVRTLPGPVTLLGQDLDPAHKVLLLLGSGNRDERRFRDPDVFDMGREGGESHLGFGHGLHFCVGSALARLETRVVLEELLDRVSDLEVDADRCMRVHISNFHGFEHMPFTAKIR
jgi:cytochrome P450